MKILVVDDDPAIREYLEEALSIMGHSVECVANGYDAIDYVREHRVSLAYIDVAMPGIDGFQTLEKIREIDPKVSAVMISGNSIQKLMDHPIEKGIYVSLAKPFTIKQLEEINNAYQEIRGPLEFIYDNPYRLNIEEVFGAKILVVDDEEEIVEVILGCLEYEGFKNLDTAWDGEDAIIRFNDKKHDVVITDIVMPKKSGIDILRHTKAISKNTQVIIITANADKNTAITAVKLGAYEYIEKPLDIETLQRIVKRAVEKKLLLDEKW